MFECFYFFYFHTTVNYVNTYIKRTICAVAHYSRIYLYVCGNPESKHGTLTYRESNQKAFKEFNQILFQLLQYDQNQCIQNLVYLCITVLYLDSVSDT